MLTIALIGPAKMGNINYKYNPYDAAFYAAFSPMSWCTIFAWIIYITHIGHSSKTSWQAFHLTIFWTRILFYFVLGFVSDVLSCRFFLITTRVAYAFYLTQFPIFFYNVGMNRHSGYFHALTTVVIVNHIWLLHLVINNFNGFFSNLYKYRAIYTKYYAS